MNQTRRLEELLIDWEDALRSGENVSPEELCVECPELLPELQLRVVSLQSMYKVLEEFDAQELDGSSADLDFEQISRYRIDRLLGRGGFGAVYLAYDETLERAVAIKIPHAERVSTQEDAKLFLSEARVVAQLDHPSIVPVYDVNQTEAGRCYVVSKYISGQDLSEILAARPWRFAETAELLAALAEALHFAHSHQVVHRDIKPANIRIGDDGQPYLLDFGIALSDQHLDDPFRAVGTPAYMSPEQARGEGHLVDGRSDVFSLGIVMYELLTGVNPFQGADWFDTIQCVRKADPQPPRQLSATVPEELQRICLKCLSARASDRYATAEELADDLRHFLTSEFSSVADSGGRRSTDSDPSSSHIVPKGLRCFEAVDADFFLDLVPGPTGRDGLPESVRFWKARIEQRDPDETFRVGLIYGPSGCGKSSLMLAGILPQLSDSVAKVYVEASATDTEARLLAGLGKHDFRPTSAGSLVEALTELRTGNVLNPGQKLLIVLDQFEQWLHAKRQEVDTTELTRALRQCDGKHVQCVALVRDDFWMAATRFFRDLDVRLSDGDNSAAVELFDPQHARTVLEKYGRAFGCLPHDQRALSEDQNSFLDQSISGLSRDGKVVCVQLSLFAEMVKGKTWSPATLKAVGGTQGVGVTFLEESLCADGAPPDHRLHQHAAKGILKTLLPDAGSDIKGSARSRADLIEASGYADRPQDFEHVIRILDRKLRLLTPMGVASTWIRESADWTVERKDEHYQLTHDYLVPSLRTWLTGKQTETRRGRAELSLADHAAAWHLKPDNRNLPNLPDYLAIHLFTDSKLWTPLERALVRQSDLGRLRQCLFWLLVFAGICFGGLAIRSNIEADRNRETAEALVRRLVDAEISNTPDIIDELRQYREWAHPLLIHLNQNASVDSAERLRTALALLPDANQATYLQQQLVTVPAPEFLVIRDQLSDVAEDHIEPLWARALDTVGDPQQRFQAAGALASYAANDSRWSQIAEFVSERLVSALPSHLSSWIDALRPAQSHLIGPLKQMCQDTERDEQQQLFAFVALAEYSADVGQLFELLRDADGRQFEVIFNALKKHGNRSLNEARRIVQSGVDVHSNAIEQRRSDRKLAYTAAALVRLGDPHVDYRLMAPLLKWQRKPLRRTLLTHTIAPATDHARVIATMLESEKEPSIRSGLVSAMGNLDPRQLSGTVRHAVQQQFLDMYADEPDPGLHGALEWVLRKWGLTAEMSKITRRLATGEIEDRRQWYVNREHQTLAVIRGPLVFKMGSPDSESNRFDYEFWHDRRIDRTFAIATKEVTVAQFQRFVAEHASIIDHTYSEEVSPSSDCPQSSVTWFLAAHYCNWLSEQDGIPPDQWCYLPNKEWGHFPNEAHIPNTAEMEFAENYLSKTGYRLPTEAEWECACRAGTLTSRYYGDADELLDQYAWYLRNSQMRTSPVGLLRPNDYGLFDMLGNVYEWCQTAGQATPQVKDGMADDPEAPNLIIKPLESRALKGGCFQDLEAYVRSAIRGGQNPGVITRTIGFRPARTLPAD